MAHRSRCMFKQVDHPSAHEFTRNPTKVPLHRSRDHTPLRGQHAGRELGAGPSHGRFSSSAIALKPVKSVSEVPTAQLNTVYWLRARFISPGPDSCDTGRSGMIPRGEVGMVAGQIGLSLGVISSRPYTAVLRLSAENTLIWSSYGPNTHYCRPHWVHCEL